MYREYGIQGRWPSPDPLGPGAFNLTNPQSLNRYAYVLNNPETFIDPLGMGPCHAGDIQVGSENGDPICKPAPGTVDIVSCPATTPDPTGPGLVDTPADLCRLQNGDRMMGPAHIYTGPDDTLLSKYQQRAQNHPARPQTPRLPPRQRQRQSQQARCSAAESIAEYLGADAAMNGLGAVFTAEIPPFAAIFGGIALVETVGSGVLAAYSQYVCNYE